MASRVVTPDTERLFISEGDWLLVKRRLNSGESRAMHRRGRRDPIEAGLAMILAYLLDWSVKGPDGAVIKIDGASDIDKESALDSIDTDSYTEILRAIEAHETAMAQARDAEKKQTDGVKNAPATSPSLSPAAGASTGSETSI